MMLQLFKKGLEVCAAILAECTDQKKSTEESLQPTHKFICIGCDFSKTPNEGLKLFGGEESGEEFRNQILTPSLLNLSKGQKLIIRLDHISEHYSCRFLYESFGELVKRNGFSPKYLSKKIEFQYEKHDFALYEKKIWRYILED